MLDSDFIPSLIFGPSRHLLLSSSSCLISSDCCSSLLSRYHRFHNDLTIAIGSCSLKSVLVDISISYSSILTISEQQYRQGPLTCIQSFHVHNLQPSVWEQVYLYYAFPSRWWSPQLYVYSLKQYHEVVCDVLNHNQGCITIAFHNNILLFFVFPLNGARFPYYLSTYFPGNITGNFPLKFICSHCDVTNITWLELGFHKFWDFFSFWW